MEKNDSEGAGGSFLKESFVWIIFALSVVLILWHTVIENNEKEWFLSSYSTFLINGSDLSFDIDHPGLPRLS